MISFVKTNKGQLTIEKEIFNTNIEYNTIAFDKEQLDINDIEQQYQESDELNIERFLVQKHSNYIGIIEYGMSSPRSQKPWLSLLIDKRYQGFGYAKDAYYTYENLMKAKQVKTIELAVHSPNQKAMTFWTSLGFKKYDQRIFEGKKFYSLEKNL